MSTLEWMVAHHQSLRAVGFDRAAIHVDMIERMRWIASPPKKQGVRNDSGGVGYIAHGFIYNADL